MGTRQLIDVSADLVAGVRLKVPIVSAPMSTVTEHGMASAMVREGGVGIIHRFMPYSEQVAEFLAVFPALAVCALGVSDGMVRALTLYDAGCKVFCIDVAHAHSLKVKKFMVELLIARPDIKLIVGNVATYEGAKYLIEYGADAIKVGIGPGSACSTRSVTGFGVPQFTAVQEVYEAVKGTRVKLIADGGIKTSGDIVKAIAAGADTVAIGYLLAGTKEAPQPGRFYGMASREAQDGLEGYVSAPEGVSASVPVDTSVTIVIENLVKGIKSGVSYGGGQDLDDIRGNVEWMQVAEGVRDESRTRV